MVGAGAGLSQGMRIPEGVREVIGQRLNRLSNQCNLMLVTASILGREFDFNLLKLVGGATDDERLLETVDEALEAHLIQEVSGYSDRHQFSHSLVQQTLAEELSTSRRGGCTPGLPKC